MMLTEPNLTAEDFAAIKCPARIAVGEFDVIRLSDTVHIHQSISRSKIAIIKFADHSSYISADGKQAYALVKEVFKES